MHDPMRASDDADDNLAEAEEHLVFSSTDLSELPEAEQGDRLSLDE